MFIRNKPLPAKLLQVLMTQQQPHPQQQQQQAAGPSPVQTQRQYRAVTLEVIGVQREREHGEEGKSEGEIGYNTKPNKIDSLVRSSKPAASNQFDFYSRSKPGMASMEAQLAHLTSWIQQNVQYHSSRAAAAGQAARATAAVSGGGRAGGHAPSNSSLDSAFSAQSGGEAEDATAVVPTATDPELAGAARKPGTTWRCLRTDLKELRQSCRHCLHSVDQIANDQSKKSAPRFESRDRTRERLKAYRLESRAIDTRYLNSSSSSRRLRSGTHPSSSESAAQRSATAAAAASATQQLQVALTAARRSLETDVARSVGKRRLPAEALAEKFRGHRIGEYDNVAQSTVDGHPPPLGISVAISAAPPPPSAASAVGGVRRAAAANQRGSTVAAAAASAPAQVAFSDTVKVDDGSQVIKPQLGRRLRARRCRCTTALAAKSPTSGSPQDAAAPPPRKSSTGGTGVTSSPLGGPGSRQRPTRLRERSGARQARSPGGGGRGAGGQRQSTVHFAAAATPTGTGVGIGNRGSCHSGDATADHAAERSVVHSLKGSDTTD
uniref:AAA domain-containing protein n=1 Tax=Macrostomum lignano TaxID=282301 RepID=A0A1I8FGL4_9PLAT